VSTQCKRPENVKTVQQLNEIEKTMEISSSRDLSSEDLSFPVCC